MSMKLKKGNKYICIRNVFVTRSERSGSYSSAFIRDLIYECNEDDYLKDTKDRNIKFSGDAEMYFKYHSSKSVINNLEIKSLVI